MKNTIKVLGTIALAIVIGFSFSACGGGGGGTPTETETPLEFNGKTASNDDITIVISRTAPRAAITPKNGDYYVIKVSGAVKSQGTISVNEEEVTFRPSSGSPFTGWFGNYGVDLFIPNIPDVGDVTLGQGVGKSVLITGLPSIISITTPEGPANGIGVFVFTEMPNGDDVPVNTAIQYTSHTTNNTALLNLVVPRDNTWNDDSNGKWQPRWNGSGDYYVLIVPFIAPIFYYENRLIYKGNGNTPLKVSFNEQNIRLAYNEFKTP